MAEMTLLEMQENYHNLLVAELLEKTKRNGILWEALDSVTYQSTLNQSSSSCPGDAPTLGTPITAAIEWQFTLKKTPLGNVSSTTTLEVLKDSTQWVFIRDTNDVESLFDVVELFVLQLDNKLKEALQFVQAIESPSS